MMKLSNKKEEAKSLKNEEGDQTIFRMMERFRKGAAKQEKAKKLMANNMQENGREQQQAEEHEQKPPRASAFAKGKAKSTKRDSRDRKEMDIAQVDIDQAFKNGKFKEEQNKLLQKQQKIQRKHDKRVSGHAVKERDNLQRMLSKPQSPSSSPHKTTHRRPAFRTETSQDRDDAFTGATMTDDRERQMQFEYTPCSRRYFTHENGIELEVDTSDYDY
jgi:hypothetical protein